MIEKIALGTYDAVIDNQTQTITFCVPLYEQDSGRISGNITAFEGNNNYVTFLIGGVEYRRSVGESAGFQTGDKVYIYIDRIYTSILKDAKQIASASVDGSTTV